MNKSRAVKNAVEKLSTPVELCIDGMANLDVAHPPMANEIRIKHRAEFTARGIQVQGRSPTDREFRSLAWDVFVAWATVRRVMPEGYAVLPLGSQGGAA